MLDNVINPNNTSEKISDILAQCVTSLTFYEIVIFFRPWTTRMTPRSSATGECVIFLMRYLACLYLNFTNFDNFFKKKRFEKSKKSIFDFCCGCIT